MSRPIVPHHHIVTRGSMKTAHNLDDRQERQSIRDEYHAPQVIRSTRLSDYTVVNGVVGRILNGRFVADTKAPIWVRIALTKGGQN